MPWFYDLPLRRKLIVSFLPIAALCLGVAGVTFRAIPGRYVGPIEES